MNPFVSEYRTLFDEPQGDVGWRIRHFRRGRRAVPGLAVACLAVRIGAIRIWASSVLLGWVLCAAPALFAGSVSDPAAPIDGLRDSEDADPEDASPGAIAPPTAVFVPSLDQIGTAVRLPAPWKLTKATSDSLEDFAGRLGTDKIPCFALFDEHGNCLVRDTHPRAGSGPRIEAALQEYANRRDELVDGFESRLARLRSAEAAGDVDRQIEIVDGIPRLAENGRPIRGYAALEKCLARRATLDVLRRQEFWALVASERTTTVRKYRRELRRLLKRSKGLPVERAIRRRLDRSERGLALVESD